MEGHTSVSVQSEQSVLLNRATIDTVGQINAVEQQINAVQQQINAVEQQINDVELDLRRQCSEMEKEYLRKEKEYLRKEKEQLRRKEEQLRDEKLQKEAGLLHLQRLPTFNDSFPKSGLPPLDVRRISSSTPSLADTHADAQLNIRPFGSYTGDLSEGHVLWTSYRQQRRFTWSNEQSICSYVGHVLVDAIAASKLSGKVDCTPEADVSTPTTRIRPDFWVIKVDGQPVGAVEVKHPGGGTAVLDSSRLHGQMFDYLMRLKAFHGLQHVFGITTTYQNWRVVWLPDSDGAAKAELDSVPEPHRSSSETIANTLLQDLEYSWQGEVDNEAEQRNDAEDDEAEERNKDNEDDDEDDEDEERNEDNEDDDQAEEVPRVLHGTRNYSFDDPSLPRVLCTALMKMYAAPVMAQTYLSPDRLAVVLTETQWRWMKMPRIEELKSQLPSTATRNFILLDHLGSGKDGRVWLACSFSGRICCIKLPHRGSAGKITQEAQLWEVVNQIPVRVLQLGGKQALLMPYVSPLSEKQRSLITGGNGDLYASLIAVIKRMADQGWCHTDLAFRNMGLLKVAGDVHQLVLLDFADAVQMQSTEALQKMLTILQEKMNVLKRYEVGINAKSVTTSDAVTSIMMKPLPMSTRPRKKRFNRGSNSN